MSCDVGKATEGLENELWRRWSDGNIGEWAELHLCQSSFSNPSVALPTSQLIHKLSVASPTSQLILQPFFRLSNDIGSSLTSPGEPPMLQSDVKLFVPIIPYQRRAIICSYYLLGVECYKLFPSSFTYRRVQLLFSISLTYTWNGIFIPNILGLQVKCISIVSH